LNKKYIYRHCTRKLGRSECSVSVVRADDRYIGMIGIGCTMTILRQCSVSMPVLNNKKLFTRGYVGIKGTVNLLALQLGRAGQGRAVIK